MVKKIVILSLILMVSTIVLNAQGTIPKDVSGYVICACGKIHSGEAVTLVEKRIDDSETGKKCSTTTDQNGYYHINYSIQKEYRYYLRVWRNPDKLITSSVHNFTTPSKSGCVFQRPPLDQQPVE